MNKPNDTNEPPPASAGSHGSASRWSGVPVAWAAVGANGVPMWLAYHRQDSEGAVVGIAEVVPLYRLPALTQDERWAIAAAVADARGQAYRAKRFVSSEVAATFEKQARLLLGLAERLN